MKANGRVEIHEEKGKEEREKEKDSVGTADPGTDTKEVFET